MKAIPANRNLPRFASIMGVTAWLCLSTCVPLSAQEPSAAKKPAPPATAAAPAKTFNTPQQAAEALVDAAEKFDEPALVAIFGPQGEDVVLTGETPQDRARATTFAAEARKKMSVDLDPKNTNRA